MCPGPAGIDAFCQQPVCESATGECGLVPDHEGLACDDGNECTFDASCLDGTCSGGAALNCNDANPCTDDSCDPATGCVHTDNTLPCTDDDVCTNGDACTDGQCQPGIPLDCDDGDVCTDDACNSQLGCQHEANAAPCDDGSACSVGDTCASGSCTAGPALECKDSNICTDDLCDSEAGCVFPANSSICNDDDLCTVGEHCSDGACAGGAPVDCNDGNPCTDDSCLPLEGCIHTPNSAPCNDGDVCTKNDACEGGSCMAGNAINCDDDNVCTTDSCSPGLGCVHAPADMACDDDNACTEGDSCNGGWCAGSVVHCDDEDQCASDSCDPEAGCQYTAIECDDESLCTDDSCNPLYGCLFLPNTVPCDDGNACTDDDTCHLYECAGALTTCNDDYGCTTDSCDTEVGCVFSDIVPCCGNSTVEEDGLELCDDGNASDWDGCRECSIVEFQVNSIWEKTERVGRDAVATFADGGYVIAWHSEVSPGLVYPSAQYFTRYSVDGSVKCDTVQVSDSTEERHDYAAVEALDDGSFLVAWRVTAPDSVPTVLHLRRFDGECQPMYAAVRVDDKELPTVRNPAVEQLSDGRLVVVWDNAVKDASWDEDLGWVYMPGVSARIVKADGTNATDVLDVNTTITGSQSNPDVAPLVEGGFVVVWQSTQWDENKYDVYLQRFDASGSKVGDETKANTMGSHWQYDQDQPTVASLGDGRFMVAWRSNSSLLYPPLMARTFDQSGEPTGDDFKLPKPPAPAPWGIAGKAEYLSLSTISHQVLGRLYRTRES